MMPELKRISPGDIESLFTTIFSGPSDTLLPTLHEWFSPIYVQVTDGHSSDFDEFTTHVTKLRTLIKTISVQVMYLIQEENKIADRHIVKLEKVDGSQATIEVLLLGERGEDGKFTRVWETARTVDGETNSADLARVR